MIAIRIVMILFFLLIAAFCAFGLLASFESPGFIGWRIVYGAAGLACLLGAAWATTATLKRR